jgi:hypothetical protein
MIVPAKQNKVIVGMRNVHSLGIDDVLHGMVELTTWIATKHTPRLETGDVAPQTSRKSVSMAD